MLLILVIKVMMRDQCRMNKKNPFMVLTERPGCIGGGKGEHGSNTSAVRGVSNILCCFYGAGINKKTKGIPRRGNENQKQKRI